jgi:uncharacterized protein YdeI (YjbR/CyaY-like superfamily)
MELPMPDKDNKPRIQVESRAEWRAWLEQNHIQPEGIWLVTFKKHVGDKYVSWDEVVEEALCFGWIDSLPRRLDEDRTMLWLAPRKPGSGWSTVNKERIERLIAAGLMMPPGLEKIDAAKRDGTWASLDGAGALEIPDDLSVAFDDYTDARQNFEGFPPSARRGILEWIGNAKRPETRSKRIEETARLAQDNIRANQWRKG